MDKRNDCFLDIIKAALLGQKAVLQEDLTQEDWQYLFQMAEIHKLLPLFYEAVYSIPALQAADTAFAAAIRQQVRHQVLNQTMRTSEFLSLCKELHAAGMRPLVVKGIICRALYPKPDHRLSADEDLLIPEEQFSMYHQVLLSNGMTTTEAEENLLTSYEIPYRKAASSLYIELHKSLFPPESSAYGDLNGFFADASERAVTETVQGVPIGTLEYTDHLFYLICHAFKHFLHSGFGIRQVCDIVMYANAYGSFVNWASVLEHCKEIHAELFAAALFQIGRKYLVFDPEKACYPPEWNSLQEEVL